MDRKRWNDINSYLYLCYLSCNNKCILLFFGIENIRTVKKLPSGKIYPRSVGMGSYRYILINYFITMNWT